MALLIRSERYRLVNVSPSGGASRIIDRVRRFTRVLISDPRDAIEALREELAQRHDRPGDQIVDELWDEKFHALLGVPWPCPVAQLVMPIWTAIPEALESRGISFGRHTYGPYSDADLSLVQAVWCAVFHLQPNVVIETGVAHGVTSRVILEALARNGRGHLWSVDQPLLFDSSLDAQIGAAVPAELLSRWTYVRGSSRRQLPSLLRTLGTVDVFVHDSLHTARNTEFEMSQAFSALSPGGVMLVDDISTHQGFSSFVKNTPSIHDLVCRSADGLGLFGIVYRDRS